MSTETHTDHESNGSSVTPKTNKGRRRLAGLAAAAVLAAGGLGVYEVTTAQDYSGAAEVAVSSNEEFGDILVDGQGRTLYMFEPDEASSVTCTGGCVSKWPPLNVPTGGTPVVGDGVQQALLGELPDENGEPVVTYAGWPLYRYESDSPGEVSGHDVDENGGLWFAVTTTGERVR